MSIYDFKATDIDGQEREVKEFEGKALENKIIVLAESADLAKEIDLAEAKAVVEDLERRINATAKDDQQYPKLYRELDVARARLSVAQSNEIA